MFDFLMISTRSPKQGVIEIYPIFMIKKSSDLMIRGGDFYAVWVEDKGLWSTDEQDVVDLVDRELKQYAERNQDKFDARVKIMYMSNSDTCVIDKWHKYCNQQLRDSFHMLDEKLIFSNTQTSKTDYASRKLPYPLEKGDISAYDKLISTLYVPEERHKIEWAIGSIVCGDSKKLQKFMVLYGAAGTGKSTILNIIEKLFEGYFSVFDAKALGSSNNVFALEAFNSNPLVAIQHDGDLSHIEDNTRLNSLVSHEKMSVNEKFKSTYVNSFKSFLFMGTNKPVKITDAKSGLIRRLIDVSPSGEKLPPGEYKELMSQIDFELGAIAAHCRDVYLSDPGYYDDYIPINMLGASNDFYNFIQDSYHVFNQNNSTTLKSAWEMYKTYCDEAKVSFPYSQRAFKEELKNYFCEYRERLNLEDGSRVRSWYGGFRKDKFEEATNHESTEKDSAVKPWLTLDTTVSNFDAICADFPAQYASDEGTPMKKWENVRTKLSDIETSKLHYVKFPESCQNHIVVDFDFPDEAGNKSLEKNLAAASRWPPTYAELSKSGCGIHLHYIYDGDIAKVSRVYSDYIEIKIFNGNSSLRRKLSKCNNLPITTINSGLPTKGEKMITFDKIKSERGLRTQILRNLNKEIHPGTKPSIDFIYKILEDAYTDGLIYDVSDMRNAIFQFAANSTHQAEYCIKLVGKMKFKSETLSEGVEDNDVPIVFYDVEVFPNLFLVNWKYLGEDKPVTRMINPSPTAIENLLKFRLIGFNCRRYDNHILYARLMGYTNEQLYILSQRIVNGNANCFFGEAYNLSYTDVYDFSSKKQSLKKFEIELGIHHQELGLPWDQPVPEERWTEVAEYCDNDVIATEAVFKARQSDFLARQILADIAGMTVNDTTNTLTTRIIFGRNKTPQSAFQYRYLSGDPMHVSPQNATTAVVTSDLTLYDGIGDPEYTVFNDQGKPIFPGYRYTNGVSTYRDEEVGEGGYVYAEPGIYGNVALLDIASMHPSSIVAENLFGDEYTKRFKDILDARIAIKHKDFDKARSMFDGALSKYLEDEETASNLASALKIAINSVYGLTSAGFENPFRDIRNRDNIVAKRGALFMINLKHEVQNRGFTVAHIKTDSIKIPDATPEIIAFVMDYGKMYGYTFEHEATYDRMCLVNDAVYIAKYKDGKHAGEWTATGTQFQVPYVFKKLFSREELVFEDFCETKAVTSALYLDMNENLPDVSKYEDEATHLWKYILDDTKPDDENKKHKRERLEELKPLIAQGHDYRFIGKVGEFCPIKPNCGGGILLREKVIKSGEKGYSAAPNSKGYRWLEAEMVKKLKKEADIDRSFYDNMVNEAVKSISTYGDFEWFVSEDPYIGPAIIDGKPMDFDAPPHY